MTTTVARTSSTMDDAEELQPESAAAPGNPANAAERVLASSTIPNPSIIVRVLRQEDVRCLEWHGGPDWRRFYEDEWERHKRGDVFAVVADFNGFPIGHAALHWQGKPSHPHIPDLQSFRVLPAFRGLGIGSLLLHVAEDLVRLRGARQLGLAVGIDNEAARRLYERHGYRIAGDPYDDVWQYVDARGETVTVREQVYDMVKDIG